MELADKFVITYCIYFIHIIYMELESDVSPEKEQDKDIQHNKRDRNRNKGGLNFFHSAHIHFLSNADVDNISDTTVGDLLDGIYIIIR